MNKNKLGKVTGVGAAAFLIAGSTAFTAFAAMPSGTAVIGDKAYDLNYVNDPANVDEVVAAMQAANFKVYVKDFAGTWIANETETEITDLSVIPAVEYKDAKGEVTNYDAKDGDVTEAAGELKVNSVSAINVKEIKVVFNKAVEDASKVAATVKQGEKDIAVSVTWNEAKTEATLSKSSNFAMGTYKVNVKIGEDDLASKDITISEQKIAKIEITSDKLGVTTDNTGAQAGYATYKVFDQYGADITSSGLANNVTFQTGVGTVEADKGLLTITPSSNLNLLTFTSGVVITASDSTSGVSTSKTLAVTSQVGTLSDITLNKITNSEDKELTAGDISTVFYIDFTALDMSGNATKKYDLLKQGLILTGDDDNELTTSNPHVKAKLVEDPSDSKNGVIEVRADEEGITMDMPVVITAMTKTGKNSQISTTLKKQAQVSTFTLFAPSESIASGEVKEIPFTAYDQNGKEITKYSDLKDLVDLTGAEWARDVNGNGIIKNKPVTNNSENPTPVVISSVVKQTGNYSSVTINIQKPVTADTLKLDTSIIKTIMQKATSAASNDGAEQKIDFGWDKGGLSVEDQYGRAIDINKAAGQDYKVVATSTNDSVVKVLSDTASAGQNQIKIKAVGEGSATIKFQLINKETNKVVDSKSQVLSVIDDEDIKDYTIDTVAKPIYAINKHDAVTDKESEYKARPKVYGTTSSGAKVVLRGTPVISANVTNSTDFTVFTGVDGGAYDSVRVIANELRDPAATSAETLLNVTLLGADGIVHTVSTTIKSSTVSPAGAVSMTAYVETSDPAISLDETNDDIVYITQSAGRTYADILGTTLAAYDESEASGVQNVYFAPVDKYGTEGWNLSRVYVVESQSTRVAGSTFNVNAKGTITGTALPGDVITVSAVTDNGLIETLELHFQGDSVETPVEVNRADLQAQITVAGTKVEADYTAESWAAMQTALTAANTVNADADATQAEVDAAKTALTNAIAALVEKP